MVLNKTFNGSCRPDTVKSASISFILSIMSSASQISFSKMLFVSRILTPKKIMSILCPWKGCNVTPTPLEFPNASSDLYGKQGLFPPLPILCYMLKLKNKPMKMK